MTAEIRPEDAVEGDAAEAYADWRRNFIRDRLRVLNYLGFIANPAFIALDFLLHREYLGSLFLIRIILQLGLLSGFLLLKYGPKSIPPNGFVILWVVVANLCITQMTVILGGFPSQYYNGLNLVYLTAAVIVPISWPSHLAAQVVTLAFYYVSNFLSVASPELNAAIENSFFLIWTCVALLFSISLYERLQRAEFQARVSERRARQELEVSNKKLLELDHLKSEFFANISHEIRTPLTLTVGAFQTLLKSALGAEPTEVIKSGLRNASRLLFLINELLDLAKFDSGRAVPRKRCLDFAALVRSVVTNFDSSPTRRIHLKGLMQPVALEADPRQLKKVLYNLLSNAFKFSDPDEGQVWIRLASTEHSIELEVEDNGIGIPPDHLQRIFDRFTQVEGGATRRYEGSGIGLALVREIVTLHGGTIAVESNLGRGSLFTITLPRGRVTDDQVFSPLEEEDDQTFLPMPSEEEKNDAALVAPVSKIHAAPLVLVVDDNADMRLYLQGILRKQYRIMTAKDGAEALEQAQRMRPDLILTDVMMPKMSGHDLLNAVRTDKVLRSIPVIFLTARAGTEARIESLESGADDYLSKPFDELELLARVGNLIRTRAQERELAQLQKEKISSFLPPKLAEMIMSGEHEDFLKGHRREITVVFIDLRGFTTFVEIAAPEEVMMILRDYQTVMGRLAAEYEGTVERFVGDAVMVYFNDPLPCPNHAQQAVKMAIAMRHAIDSLRGVWQTQGIHLGAGIGIATGYATIGAIGFEGRKDYAAIGPVTNLAARLCSEAQHGQILVSDRVISLVKDLVTTVSMGELTLKGVHKPVAACQVLSIRT